MRKLWGGVMIAVAVFFLALIVKGAVAMPGTQGQLNGAAFVEDGRILPENEGRLVIVCGVPETRQNARDDELGITLPSACAARYVEVLTAHAGGSKGSMKWEPVTGISSDWLRQRQLFGSVYFGEFEIDEGLLTGVSAGKEVALSAFDTGEVRALEAHNITTVEKGGVVYFSEAPESCFAGSLRELDYGEYEGLRRVHYRVWDASASGSCAVVGIQRGGRLVKDEALDAAAFYENVHSKGDVVRQSSLYTILGMAFAALVCALLIFFGVRKIRE